MNIEKKLLINEKSKSKKIAIYEKIYVDNVQIYSTLTFCDSYDFENDTIWLYNGNIIIKGIDLSSFIVEFYVDFKKIV